MNPPYEDILWITTWILRPVRKLSSRAKFLTCFSATTFWILWHILSENAGKRNRHTVDQSNIFLNGRLNKHSIPYWSGENPHYFRESDTHYLQRPAIWWKTKVHVIDCLSFFINQISIWIVCTDFQFSSMSKFDKP